MQQSSQTKYIQDWIPYPQQWSTHSLPHLRKWKLSFAQNESLRDIFSFFPVFSYPPPICLHILLPLPLDYSLYQTTSQSLTVSPIFQTTVFSCLGYDNNLLNSFPASACIILQPILITASKDMFSSHKSNHASVCLHHQWHHYAWNNSPYLACKAPICSVPLLPLWPSLRVSDFHSGKDDW